MIYQYTETNIACLLQSVGTLEEAQLVRFFADELPPHRVRRLLEELALRREIVHDRERGTYSAVGVPAVVDEVARRRILAFWAVANMGSDSVYEILTTRYPTQFLVISPDSASYDFTVVETPGEARVAARVMAESLMQNVPDDISHVAVVQRPSEEEKLRGALVETGFDCCCIADAQAGSVVYRSYDGL